MTQIENLIFSTILLKINFLSKFLPKHQKRKCCLTFQASRVKPFFAHFVHKKKKKMSISSISLESLNIDRARETTTENYIKCCGSIFHQSSFELNHVWDWVKLTVGHSLFNFSVCVCCRVAKLAGIVL